MRARKQACCAICHELITACEAETWEHLSRRRDHQGENGWGACGRSKVIEVWDGDLHLTGPAAQEYATDRIVHNRTMAELEERYRRTAAS